MTTAARALLRFVERMRWAIRDDAIESDSPHEAEHVANGSDVTALR